MTDPPRAHSAVGLSLLLCLVSMGGCTEHVEHEAEVESFRVSFTGNPDLGSPEKLLAPILHDETKKTLVVSVEALQGNQLDSTFTGWVVIEAQPVGKLYADECKARQDCWADPVAMYLNQGKISNVTVEIEKAWGTVRLVAKDVGYLPPKTITQTACKNGLDDDGDGYRDYPVLKGTEEIPLQNGDRGCYDPTDDSEEGGSGVSGASDSIFFAYPRLKDIQTPGNANGDQSPLVKEHISIDRGWLLVTQVSPDGFYVTDFEGARWNDAQKSWDIDQEAVAFGSIYVFNYSVPINLIEGDCLVQLDGNLEEFYNFTEVNKPTWKKGDFAFCAQKARMAGLSDCPEKNEDLSSSEGIRCRQRVAQLATSPIVDDLTKKTIKVGSVDRSAWDQAGYQTERYESALVQLKNVQLFTEIKTCDRDGDGRINYRDTEEGACGNSCGKDVQCTTMESLRLYNQWTGFFLDGINVQREIAVVVTGSAQSFDPLKAQETAQKTGQPKIFSRLVGTLRHFRYGTPPWILQVRRPGDCPDCFNEEAQ